MDPNSTPTSGTSDPMRRLIEAAHAGRRTVMVSWAEVVHLAGTGALAIVDEWSHPQSVDVHGALVDLGGVLYWATFGESSGWLDRG